MRNIFLALIAFSFVSLQGADSVSKPSCYSVEIVSESNTQKNYDRLSSNKYEESCRLMNISSNLKVRCGCYDEKAEINVLFEKLKKKYKSAKVTQTYKSRFKDKVAVPVVAKKEELAVVTTSSISGSVDLSNYQNVQKKDSKIIFDTNSSDIDGVYNYDYNENIASNNSETNVFLDGDFEKIHRYESLYFNDNTLTTDSNETFKKIIEQIHSYTDDKSRGIVVSILGFTQKIEHENDEISLDSAYTNFFQKIAKRDNLNPKSASEDSMNYMEIVYKKMLDDDIAKEIIYKENRVGKDNLFTEEFSDGRSLNNRVDVAIYVKEVLDPDTDKDGVRDSKDYCPETPIGSHVDQNGCPLIMSLDLKFDFDKATISEQKSLDNVQELSNFMKKYPAYHANILGHTDSDGSDKYNQVLSLKRAEVVKLLIIKDGVKASRLSYEGRGESEPLFDNINEINRHKNRRTEVELTLPSPESKRSQIRPRSRGVE